MPIISHSLPKNSHRIDVQIFATQCNPYAGFLVVGSDKLFKMALVSVEFFM
jgi:hypothetical protein